MPLRRVRLRVHTVRSGLLLRRPAVRAPAVRLALPVRARLWRLALPVRARRRLVPGGSGL